jgi:hypothetical protein
MAAALQQNDGDGGWKVEPTDVENIQRHSTNLVESMQQLHRRVSSAHQKQRRRGRQLESRGKLPNFACRRFRATGASEKGWHNTKASGDVVRTVLHYSCS